MSKIAYYNASRWFCIWRWFYALVLIALTVIFAVPCPDGSILIAYYYLFSGVLPAAVFLWLRHTGSRWACWFAYAYDLFLCALFVAALALLPLWTSYMGLGFMMYLAGFIAEGVFLTVVLIRSRLSSTG